MNRVMRKTDMNAYDIIVTIHKCDEDGPREIKVGDIWFDGGYWVANDRKGKKIAGQWTSSEPAAIAVMVACTCGICGGAPIVDDCSFQCPNSDRYYSREREMEDDHWNDGSDDHRERYHAEMLDAKLEAEYDMEEV